MSTAFAKLSKLYEQLENTSSTIAMRKTLADFFKKTPKKDVDKVAYLTLGQIAPEYTEITMGIATKTALKSIAEAFGKKQEEVQQEFKKKGDVGKVAESFATKKREKLTVKTVFETLHKIAKATGKGSQEKKTGLLAKLLRDASPLEARYLARIVLGTLRLGVGDKTVLDALTLAFTGTMKAKPEVEHAYYVCSDVGEIAKTIATSKLEGIKKISVKLGRPLQSMLCQRVKKLEEIKEKIGYPVAVEVKYDGERVQAHKDNNKITLYSRRLENITAQFPDIVEAVKKAVKTKKCVVDGEIMPVDEKGNLLSFQKLMQRRRKYEVEKYAKKIPAVLFVFDIIYANGKPLTKQPYKKRYALLKKTVKETQKVRLALRKECADTDCVEEMFHKTIEHGGEGIVIKNLQGVYEAGVRGWNWVKWKPEYVKGLRDTFDLVVAGAYHGRGKRAGTYGALLCAAYNKKQDRFETFCKLGSGFTDEQLENLPKKFKKYEVKKKPARLNVTKLMKPDVWFSPEVVVEVVGAEITRSPNHTCAVKDGKGLALRFPRFNRWRPDKKPEQATTVKEIIQIAKKKTR